MANSPRSKPAVERHRVINLNPKLFVVIVVFGYSITWNCILLVSTPVGVVTVT